MSLSETRTFLQDLVLRFDPELDLSEGSRADAELIQPILIRIGPDPFDEDIHVFVRERVRQAFPDLAITEVDEFTDLFIDPMRILTEPLAREVKLIKLRASLRNHESLSDAEIDSLMGNFFEPRIAGGYAVGIVRAYFASPQTISISQTSLATTRGGLRFHPTRTQTITSDQMRTNIDGSEYYFDVNYTAEKRGTEYNVDRDEIVSIANLPTVTRVRNLRRFRNGTARETSAEYIGRVQAGLGDRTLTADRGIVATVRESFPDARSVLVVGFQDPEMTRDIIRGGGLGPIPASDVYGVFYGSGSIQNDLDGDLTSPRVLAAGGNFLARLGAVGDTPEGWYLSLTYTDSTGLVMVDTPILEVLADTVVRVEAEIEVGATGLTWALREFKITLTDIPGGITLPDTAEGTLELRSDSIHIGGKNDIYVGGSTEIRTAQITSLSDETPLASGYALTTVAGDDEITLTDLGISSDLIEQGMTLVLEEGVDVGSYLIVEVTGPTTLRLDTAMTGTATDVSWRVVDDIDVELTDPKQIKAAGDDLLMSAGSTTVLTSSGFNFQNAGIAVGDVLEVTADLGGGEFIVDTVGVTTLILTTPASRTVSAAAWRIFTRSGAVEAPVVRVVGLELLDGVGAPTGTTIPYRDPVLVRSAAFQNEGSALAWDAKVASGIVSYGLNTGEALVGIGSTTLEWEIYDPANPWAGTVDAGTFTFSAGDKTTTQMVAELNADPSLQAAGVAAEVLADENNYEYVGLAASRRLVLSGGTALADPDQLLRIPVGISNAHVRSMEMFTLQTFITERVRLGDATEFMDGSNAGLTHRVIGEPVLQSDRIYTQLGSGPIGPKQGVDAAYDAAVLAPSVGSRLRIGRASFGSARVYFLEPTSVEFPYRDAVFGVEVAGIPLQYVPDPENLRQILPASPSTSMQAAGDTSVPTTLEDAAVDFHALGVRAGDLLEIPFIPVTGSAALSSVGTIAVGGFTLRLRIGTDPWIVITFPYAMSRQDVVDYINAQVGQDIASLQSGVLWFIASQSIELDEVLSTVITDATNPLFLSAQPPCTEYDQSGPYIISAVGATTLYLAPITGTPGTQSYVYYRVLRYVQRISSTEMNLQLDSSGLYYVDVQLAGKGPGNDRNISANLTMTETGHVSDGYRLRTENEATSFSRAEVLHAEISRSLLLVGSSDSPQEYVQLSQQDVQVTYDRSPLVDDVQSFVNAKFNRVVCSEPLVRHLLPHYVSLAWNYAGGSSEADMLRVIIDFLDTVEADDGIEVQDLINELRKKGATSVYILDSSAASGRAAPIMVVIYHDTDREVHALLVTDEVDTVRTQRFIPGDITVRRTSPGGIR